MPGSLLDHIVLREPLLERFALLTRPCRQRLLIVTDGGLDFSTNGFGLSRCIAALLAHSPQPNITLAHRTQGNHSVTIAGINFGVLGGFHFHAAAPAVTTANYDQVWMFGILPGGAGFSLAANEIAVLSTFMNAGGGVFSTGDHATLGQAMGGELPRIRHMRDWASIPMGAEVAPTNPGDPDPRNRIDTIVDPGEGPAGLYQFDDQSDSIPQRIYPNYRVTWSMGGTWTATIHPLLSLGGPATRTTSAGFTNDMDVMPDHPHESVCLEVSPSANAAALNGAYSLHGLNFQEFPNAVAGGGRVGSEIVAYAVSGGRAVQNGAWKPPVYPRMFGIMSAFDGHAAQPYSGTVRPGRIVCDSTWHHFVNINIDGTDNNAGFHGLGIGFGPGWTPSPACNKIFQYYRNILKYLTPFNRQSCWIYLELVAVRLNPILVEELMILPDLNDVAAVENVGLAAIRLLDGAHGDGTAAEAVRVALRLDPSASALADAGEEDPLAAEGPGGANRIVAYSLGRTLIELARALPVDQLEKISRSLKAKEHERSEQALMKSIASAAVEGVKMQTANLTGRLERLSALSRRCR